MILSDCPELREIEWRCVIIDEAHRLKNRNCKLLDSLKHMDLVRERWGGARRRGRGKRGDPPVPLRGAERGSLKVCVGSWLHLEMFELILCSGGWS